jgi:hypothetical protein
LHHIDPSTVDNNIHVIFAHGLGKVDWDSQLSAARPDAAVEQDVVDKLAAMAGGLFIWAATACRFVL